eukprot:1012599-Prymnesium_polylepis.1
MLHENHLHGGRFHHSERNADEDREENETDSVTEPNGEERDSSIVDGLAERPFLAVRRHQPPEDESAGEPDEYDRYDRDDGLAPQLLGVGARQRQFRQPVVVILIVLLRRLQRARQPVEQLVDEAPKYAEAPSEQSYPDDAPDQGEKTATHRARSKRAVPNLPPIRGEIHGSIHERAHEGRGVGSQQDLPSISQ